MSERTLILVAVLTLACGCQSDVNVPAPPTGKNVSFSTDILPILNDQCVSCHQPGAFANTFGGIAMDLTAANAFASIVNQPSSQDQAFTLVVPGDSAGSLFFQKVSSNNPPIGSRMPLIGDPLSPEELGLLRDWIDQGAIDN